MKLINIRDEERNNKYFKKIEIFGLNIRIRDKRKEEIAKFINSKMDGYISYIKYETYGEDIKIPKVKSKEELINLLINSNQSIARYGDGEFSLIKGSDIAFQKQNNELQQRLRDILTSKNKNLEVCVPNVFNSLKTFTVKEQYFWRWYMSQHREDLYQYLDFDKIYYDSFISRPYLNLKDKSHVSSYFQNLKQIWKDKDIVFVEGIGSRLGLGNDLFDTARSIRRILCPNVCAFSKYDEILRECKKLSKDILFILALGPTATILADDLSREGWRALDMGHIDIEYEWFLAKADTKIDIKNKNVNESKGKKDNKDKKNKINDELYQAQVLCEIK